MINFFKNLFGGSKVDLNELFLKGAQIIDVRTSVEFANGHIKQSINIPLQELQGKLGDLDPKRAVITCCASGVRSESAKSILKQNGFEVYNGGGWRDLQKKLLS